jgi:hypothetical protein
MTIPIFNVHPILLDAVLDASAALTDIQHQRTSIPENEELFDELYDKPGAEVVVPDLQRADGTYELHVWEIDSPTSLTKWERQADAAGLMRSVSGTHTKWGAAVIIVVVPPRVSVPSQPPQEGPPAPGTTQKKINVKIRKQGDLPL